MKFSTQHKPFVDTLRLYAVKWHYGLLNGFLKLAARVLFEPINNPQRILVIRKGNLGDLICSLPAFKSIRHRFPDAKLVLLTTHGGNSSLGFKQVFNNHVFDDIIETTEFRSSTLFKEIKEGAFDTVLELPQDVDTSYTQLRNLVYFRFAGITQGAGWTISNTLLFRHTQLKYILFENEQNRLNTILNEAGIVALAENDIIDVTEASKSRVMELLKTKGSTNKQKNIAIASGAKLDRKKWPLAYYKEVMNWLISKGYQIVLIGDKKDAADWGEVEHDQVLNCCGKLSVEESAAMFAQCRLTICNDSGPMHLSYASGTPVIALFSARNYLNKWFPPANAQHKVFIHTDVPCAICRDRNCGSNICMQRILPAEIIQHLNQYLN